MNIIIATIKISNIENAINLKEKHKDEFERRRQAQSEMKTDFTLSKIYNYIRMLDGEGDIN